MQIGSQSGLFLYWPVTISAYTSENGNLKVFFGRFSEREGMVRDVLRGNPRASFQCIAGLAFR